MAAGADENGRANGIVEQPLPGVPPQGRQWFAKLESGTAATQQEFVKLAPPDAITHGVIVGSGNSTTLAHRRNEAGNRLKHCSLTVSSAVELQGVVRRNPTGTHFIARETALIDDDDALT